MLLKCLKSNLSVMFCIILCSSLHAAEQNDILITDFDEPYFTASNGKKDYYPGWKFEGDAWGRGPRDSVDNQAFRISNISGQFALSSVRPGDQGTGKVLSPAFRLDRDYITFLIGGGNYKGSTCMNLLINGSVVRSATGRNDDRLSAASFDVKELKGKVAQLEILDYQRGLWGHITVDRLMMSNKPSGKVYNTVNELVNAVVQNTDSRVEGILSVDESGMKVSGKAIDISKVLYMGFEGESKDALPPHSIRFKNGELWRVTIHTLDEGLLRIKHKAFGDHKIKLSDLSGLEFNSQVRLASNFQEKSMYVLGRETLPGKILKIKEKEILYDSPLGILPLQRNTLVRYYFNKDFQNDSKETSDQICLHDGTILRGKVSLTAKGIEIDHKTLKKVNLPYASVRFMLRYNPAIEWLNNSPFKVSEAVGPIRPSPSPKTVDYRFDTSGGMNILNKLRVYPNTTMQYKLPSETEKHQLRFSLANLINARADLQVSILVDKQTVWNGRVKGGEAPKNLSLDLPAGKALVIKVSFADQIAFPCAIEFRDAYLLTTNLKKN